MNLFGKRKADPGTAARIEGLEARLLKVESHARTLESEVIDMAQRVQKWMRRALAAERTAERTPDAEPATAPATHGPVSPPSGLSPVRMRRWLRDHGQLNLSGVNGDALGAEE